ncbi:MAG: GTPase ObgE [Candidatus Sericytochromatia bacterium]|nr:GTPase ObgE [Candidatus Sericytochromatia bacterium]
MFIDRASISVRSGKGGDGVVMWRREKYVPAGGPAGGDGGRGGSVWLVATDDLNTLLDFRYQHKFVAADGERGRPKNQHGKAAEDVEVRVPVGTVIYDSPSEELLADLHQAGMRYLAAQGGRGGRGNSHFATPTRKAPDFAEPGTPGEHRELKLELKLLADVGLVGLPNAGKSSLITAVSAARPKVADYPFTTLEPHLGVVRFGPGETLVLADIPGLVEGASAGTGLGHEFLRHVERCRLLVHVLDLSGGLEERDVLNDYDVIETELRRYSPELADRPRVVALNKVDLPGALAAAPALKADIEKRGIPCFVISAAAHEGLDDLLRHLRQRVAELPPPVVFRPVPAERPLVAEEEARIEKGPDGWTVTHSRLERQVAHLNLESAGAVVKFHQLLDQHRIVERLREMGVQDGDTVTIGDFAFDFID